MNDHSRKESTEWSNFSYPNNPPSTPPPSVITRLSYLCCLKLLERIVYSWLFFPVLRYNLHITLYSFKVYNMMILCYSSLFYLTAFNLVLLSMPCNRSSFWHNSLGIQENGNFFLTSSWHLSLVITLLPLKKFSCLIRQFSLLMLLLLLPLLLSLLLRLPFPPSFLKCWYFQGF